MKGDYTMGRIAPSDQMEQELMKGVQSRKTGSAFATSRGE